MFYAEVRTDNDDAEKFSAYSLNTLPGKYKSEEVLLYGVETGQQICDRQIWETEYIFPVPMRINFRYRSGDTITLKEKYEKDEYSFTGGRHL